MVKSLPGSVLTKNAISSPARTEVREQYPSIQGQLVAVRARRDGITVLSEDGLVLEGPGTGEPDRTSAGPALRPSRPIGG